MASVAPGLWIPPLQEGRRRPTGAAQPRWSVQCPVARARLVRQLSRLAWLLDTSFEVPGTRIRLGLDPLLGLVPLVGDAVSLLLSLYIIVQASRLGVARSVLALMLLNVLIDFAVGALPFVGDIADVFMRANVRNLRLIGVEPRF